MHGKLTRLLMMILSVALGCIAASAQGSYSAIGFGESSLGDAARAARTQHQQSAKASFTLTNDDLQRERIIAPITEAVAVNPAKKLEAKKTPMAIAPTPAPTMAKVERERILNQPTPKSVDEKSTFSLGEYAKAVREQKLERATQEQSAHQIMTTPEQNVVALVTVPTQLSAKPDVKLAHPAESLGEIARAARAEKIVNLPVRTIVRSESESTDAEVHWTTIPVGSASAIVAAVVRPTPKSVAVAGKSVRAVVVETAAGPSIEVKSGDSLWKLSAKHFGDGRLWTALWKANPALKNPNLVRIGQVLRNPSAEQLASAQPRNVQNSMVFAAATHQGQKSVLGANTNRNRSMVSAVSFPRLADPSPFSAYDVAPIDPFKD